MTQTVIIGSDSERRLAHKLVDAAPVNAVVSIKPPGRNLDQNKLMWALLSDISRAKPDGRRWIPETWKCAFMHSLGHQVKFCEGLDDSGPFPIGFASSRLTVKQMADLITVIMEYGDRHSVKWSRPL